MTKPTKPAPPKSKVDALAAMPVRSLFGKPKPLLNVIPIRSKVVATNVATTAAPSHGARRAAVATNVATRVATTDETDETSETASRHGQYKDPDARRAKERERMRAKRAAAKKG